MLAFLVLLFSFSIFLIGKDFLHLPLHELQTLVFLTLVFTGQGNIYLVRERRHWWNSRPSNWLFFVTFVDILIVSLMAIFGILLAPINPILILLLFMGTACYLFLIDFLKIRVFSYLNFWQGIHVRVKPLNQFLINPCFNKALSQKKLGSSRAPFWT